MVECLPTQVDIPQDVLSQEIDGETVLLNLADERYFGLDEVGTRIWQLLNEHGSAESVVPLIQAEYEVDESTLRSDLADLIDKLAEAGLVSVKELD